MRPLGAHRDSLDLDTVHAKAPFVPTDCLIRIHDYAMTVEGGGFGELIRESTNVDKGPAILGIERLQKEGPLSVIQGRCGAAARVGTGGERSAPRMTG